LKETLKQAFQTFGNKTVKPLHLSNNDNRLSFRNISAMQFSGQIFAHVIFR
jgi:hypothetical protein